jgi:uncharacterized membrane protein
VDRPARGRARPRRRGRSPALTAPGRRLRASHGAFGSDRFGVAAERFARFFGTPGFLVGQTVVVAGWIVLNALAIGLRWDPYPFILLNLLFSTQAAYAAPLILLAQTRQADRDRLQAELAEQHRDAMTERYDRLLEENLALTRRLAELAERRG